MQIDSGLYQYIFKRASYPLYLRYRVNKFELGCLAGLSGYLMHIGRAYCGANDFIRYQTGNSREKVKIRGYLRGLLDKQMIGQFEYHNKPGTQSIGISDLGIEVLRQFDTSLAAFAEKFKPAPKPYVIDLAPSFTDEPNPQYKRTA